MTGVTVIGMSGGPLPESALAVLASAGAVAGGARHLDAVALPPSCERIVIGPLTDALDRLRAVAADEGSGPAVVLASGDPGFFGIVRRLRAEGFDPSVLVAPSSVATAFARLGISWDGAVVASAHGHDLRRALNTCRAMPVVAVLTAPSAGATELARGLLGWNRRIVVMERLGESDERVVGPLPAKDAATCAWRHPNVVVSLAEPDGGRAEPDGGRADNQPAAAPGGGWALPESAYVHRDSMITKSEVRAVALAGLRPRLGRLVWDVGAGSGSVGIECALLGAAVVAVDADPRACAQVLQNAAAHGVGHAVRVVEGAAPGALGGLPFPDAVFVGGGGTGTVAAVAALRPSRVVVTLAAIDRVAPAVQALRENGFTVSGTQLAASRLTDLAGGSLRFAGTNPVVVLTGELS
ncbi:MAG: precorrin-6B C5,15-methyltransferase / cobalt-precorrin-6B C5,C15-methyltransferase [Actinomycetota bacterium]|nr:precorrin-6B C5,15-methyltransferase / cobalt-precorrin-6B C5,C15-methyltransferase [Actinomycetota bacterium]